jgi:hypothetical protein
MTEKNLYKVYDESDVEVVYSRGDWQDWAQMRRWVEREGESDNELTPGEVHHLGEDLKCLQEEGVGFADDPHQAYGLMREHCRHELSNT